MPVKNQSITITYKAWDTSNDIPETGDVGNHTLRWMKDGGTPAAPTNSPSEVDATNMPGDYQLTLTADETNCDIGTLGGKSIGDVYIFAPEIPFTQSHLGPGADSVTLTFTDASSSAAIADADIWITTSTASTPSLTEPLQTNSSGEVTALLDDASTYYVWLQKDGVTSIQGTSFVADSGSGNAFTTTTGTAGSSASETQLVNMALILLGEDTIDTMDDVTIKAARIAKTIFDDTRDSVLEDHTWKAATKRTTLSVSTTTPSWDYAAQYDLPADFLRLQQIKDNPNRYSIEEDVILSDDETGPLKIKYTFQLDDPVKMDKSLRAAISARLAMELALPLTNSPQKLAAMEAIYDKRLANARFLDSSQRRHESMETNTWLDSRNGTSPYRAIEDATE